MLAGMPRNWQYEQVLSDLDARNQGLAILTQNCYGDIQISILSYFLRNIKSFLTTCMSTRSRIWMLENCPRPRNLDPKLLRQRQMFNNILRNIEIFLTTCCPLKRSYGN